MSFLVVALFAGLVASLILVKIVRAFDLGVGFNSGAGLIGGGIGAQLMSIFGPLAATSTGEVMLDLVAGAAGGAGLVGLIGLLRFFMMR